VPDDATRVYLVAKDTGNVLHASNTETIPVGSTNFEVVHSAITSSSADRWFVTPGDIGFTRLVSEGYGRWLHSSATVRSGPNHLLNYTTATDDALNAKEYAWENVDAENTFSTTGYFRLFNKRTALWLKYGTDDPTPSGRQRVYQAPADQATTLYIY
jgi:hypothetical protein